MLKKEEAKQIIVIKGENHTPYKLYIFECSLCKGDIRSRSVYLKTHSGICRYCSSKKTIKIAQLKNRLRPHEARYNSFKHKCPETDLTFDDYLEFVKINNCHYCNKQIFWEEYPKNNYGFNLDRMNNNIGHLKGNLVVCCGDCNKTKRDYFTYEEFMLLSPILKLIRENRQIAIGKK